MKPESWVRHDQRDRPSGKVITKPASKDAYRTDIAEAAVKELEDDDVDVQGDDWEAENVEVTEGGA